MNVWIVAKREMKLGFRNPWAYSFLALFSVFSLAILFIQSQTQIKGYTQSTGVMMNLTLYLLPLMTLLLGSLSITSEKEEGGWALLSTYTLSSTAYIVGKYTGLSAVLLSIVSFGYGLSGVVGGFFGKSYDVQTFLIFVVFSFLLIFIFLGIAIWLGTISRNRWQALTFAVSVWFFYIIGWSTILIAVLNRLPYTWIKPIISVFTIFNPAELLRIFMVVKMGGGNIFGPEYYYWIGWMQSTSGTASFIAVVSIWIGSTLGFAIWIWERRRKRDESN